MGEEGLETMVQGHLGDHDNNGNLNEGMTRHWRELCTRRDVNGPRQGSAMESEVSSQENRDVGEI